MAGTSYTRQSTLTDGDTITALLFNAEYNQLVTAFSYSATGTTGHQHDGGAGEGGNIEIIGDQDFLNKLVVDGTNNRFGVFVEVGGSAVEQIRIQDGAIVPVTTNDIDLGTASLEFKDGFFDGTIHVDTLDVDANATVAGTLGVTGVLTATSLDISGDVDVDGTLETDALSIASVVVTSTAAELNLLDGVTSTTAELNILDGVTSTFTELNLLDGVTSTTAELNILDGVTADSAEINLLDGVTSTTAELNILDGVTSTAAEINALDGITAVVGELNALDLGATAVGTAVASKAVILDANKDYTGIRNLTATGTVDATTVEFDNLSGTGAVSVTNILDEDDLVSDSATALATQQSIKAYVDAQVDTTDTLAEILAIGNTSGGTNVELTTTDKVQFRDAAIYINSSADGQLDIVADTEIQIVATTVDINGAVDVSGEIIAASLDISGDIDVDGTTNLDVVDIDGAVDMASTALVTGVLTTTAATVFNGGFASNANSSFSSSLTHAANAALATFNNTATGEPVAIYLGAIADNGGAGNKGAIYFDAGADGSVANNSLSFNADHQSNITPDMTITPSGVSIAGTLGVTGVLTGASLDISGDIDVDGVTNLDVVDIDGALTQDGGAVFNESGADVDFRVESNTNTHALFVQGSVGNIGIGTASPAAYAHIVPTDAELNDQFVGLRVSRSVSLKSAQYGTINQSGGALTLTSTVTTGSASGSVRLLSSDDGSSTKTLANFANNNDLSLYEDTGTTAKFFWDASAESLALSGTGGLAVTGDYSSTTSGTSNLRLGVNAGNSIIAGGNYNTVVGDEAGTAITTGDANTTVGYDAGKSITTGIYNTFLGTWSGDAHTVGYNNVAIGNNAFGSDVSSRACVAVGSSALRDMNNTDTDAYNTAVGFAAGAAITTGTHNTAIGGLALDANTTASNNTAVGYGALTANSTGASNVAIGYSSGAAVTTGNVNSCLGYQAGSSITSGGGNICLGRDSGLSGSPGGAITSASNILSLGDENIATANIQVDWTVASDARDKTDFTTLDLGLDFVNALTPYTYKWDKRSKYGDKSSEGYDLNAQVPDGTHKEDWLDIGFKAQDIEALEIAAGYTKDNSTNLVSSHTSDGKQMGLQYSKFVPILVKAVQEQQALITNLTERLEALEA